MTRRPTALRKPIDQPTPHRLDVPEHVVPLVDVQHRGQFDVVLLRNVLIYFTKPDQEKVLANIDRSLQPDGALIIGESETLSPLKTNFTAVSPLIYQTEKAVSGKAA